MRKQSPEMQAAHQQKPPKAGRKPLREAVSGMLSKDKASASKEKEHEPEVKTAMAKVTSRRMLADDSSGISDSASVALSGGAVSLVGLGAIYLATDGFSILKSLIGVTQNEFIVQGAFFAGGLVFLALGAYGFYLAAKARR